MLVHFLDGTQGDEKEGTTEHLNQFCFKSLDIKLNFTRTVHMHSNSPSIWPGVSKGRNCCPPLPSPQKSEKKILNKKEQSHRNNLNVNANEYLLCARS